MVMLRKRIRDEKINVRKFVLQVLVSILKYCDVLGMKEDLLILQDQCWDFVVFVWKQVFQFFIEFFMVQFRCMQIQIVWLWGLVLVVMDCESIVQEKVLECLNQLLLQNIWYYSYFYVDDDSQVFIWVFFIFFIMESQELS